MATKSKSKKAPKDEGAIEAILPPKKKRINPKTLENLQQAGAPSRNPEGHNQWTHPKDPSVVPVKPSGRPVGSSFKVFAREMFAKSLNTPVGESNAMEALLNGFTDAALTKPNSWQAKAMMERIMPNSLDELDEVLNKIKTRDTDFLSYRIIKTCHDIQQRIVLSKERVIYLMAGRRAGKTECMVRKAVDKALTTEGALILFIGLSFSRCIDLFWDNTIGLLSQLSYTPAEQRRNDGEIVLDNGSRLCFKGNSTIDERNKMRGSKWDIVLIDEAQSQKSLSVLLNEIIEPTLIDKRGQLIVAGTGPRTRGTYWEELWTNTKDHKALRINWNMSENPFIPDYEKVLQEIREAKGLTESSPLFIREYLGQICYDDDAMVFRLADNNVYTDDDLARWIASQPIGDIRITGGLDYGYVDYDAFVIIVYSVSMAEKFLVYEYKANRNGVVDLASSIKKGMEYIQNNPLFSAIPQKGFYIFTDTNEQKISYDLGNSYQLPIRNAMKYDKDFAIGKLQEEVRTGNLKVRRTMRGDGSGASIIDPLSFYAETMRTIYKRNDKDELTHEIDDDNYHPDLMDAILYSLRYAWTYGAKSVQP